MAKLFLLPGFGEDKRVFHKMKKYLTGHELVDVDYRPALEAFPIKDITMEAFVRKLRSYYGIQAGDTLVGHSLGGFISYHMRQQIDCRNCLIGSYSDRKKIKVIVANLSVSHFFIGKGFLKSTAFKWGAKKLHQNSNSYQDLLDILDVHEYYGEDNLARLTTLAFTPKLASGIEPSLRIHAPKDEIVAPPDEPYRKVGGKHLGVSTHANIIGPMVGEWAG